MCKHFVDILKKITFENFTSKLISKMMISISDKVSVLLGKEKLNEP